MTERWVPIPDCPPYMVSDQGRVRGFKDMILSDRRRNTTGYVQVVLSTEDGRVARCVHNLVLEAFIGPRPEGLECRHLNDVKHDNRLVNLRWGTKSENQYDAVRNGTHPMSRRTHCKRGHEFTPENTGKRHDNTGRLCLACRRERKQDMTNSDPMTNSEEDTVNEETKINTEDKIDTETKINTDTETKINTEPAKAKRTPAIRCPRCSKRMVKPVERNALSRVDNKTYICSTCGTAEAVFTMVEEEGKPLPPLDREVWS